MLLFLLLWLKVDLYAQTILSSTEDVCAGEIRSYRVEGFVNSQIYWNVTGGIIVNDGTDQGTSYNEATVLSGSVYESIIQVRWGNTAGSFQLIAREETTASCVSGDLVLDVTVHLLPDLSGVSFSVSSPVCYNTSPNFTVTGLIPNKSYKIGYDDNGAFKTEIVTTNSSGSCTLAVVAITADASYNIESIAFNDGVSDCEVNPFPSFSAKLALLDNIDPVLFCVGNQNKASDAGFCYYTVVGTEFDLTSYSDNCTITSIANNFNGGTTLDGAQFPKGTTTVVWTITDNAGNSSTCSFDVTVADTQAPVADVVNLPDINAQCEVTSLTAPTATDNCDGSITGITSTLLPITTQGTTIVTWTYTDVSGNTTTQTQNVIIDDTVLPVITCSGNQNANYTTSCDYTLLDYTGMAIVSDNCDSSPIISQSPLAGTIVTANTTVTLTATDASGNSSNCSFDVLLTDNIAPVLSDISDLSLVDCAENESVIPQVKSFSGLELPATRYSDNCSSSFVVEYRIQLPDSSFANSYGIQATGATSASDPSGFEFPEGVSIVHFRVLDASGNISNVKTYSVSVNHKPNPSDINF